MPVDNTCSDLDPVRFAGRFDDGKWVRDFFPMVSLEKRASDHLQTAQSYHQESLWHTQTRCPEVTQGVLRQGAQELRSGERLAPSLVGSRTTTVMALRVTSLLRGGD